jgi:hypothetical protein
MSSILCTLDVKHRAPQNLKFTIVACFYPPSIPTTAGTPLTTGTPLATTSTLAPTTTTMNYCAEENGMNQPLTIQPNQFTSNQPFDQTTPTTGDINPTSITPGLNFPSTNPLINITLDQPAALTVIYVPTDRPNQSTNVEQFVVVFVYPNGTTSQPFTSQTPSTTGTTTPSTGVSLETTTTLQTPSGVVPPSVVSPQVDLPPNFQVPENTIVIINITSTQQNAPPTGVCIVYLHFSVGSSKAESVFIMMGLV